MYIYKYIYIYIYIQYIYIYIYGDLCCTLLGVASSICFQLFDLTLFGLLTFQASAFCASIGNNSSALLLHFSSLIKQMSTLWTILFALENSFFEQIKR